MQNIKQNSNILLCSCCNDKIFSTYSKKIKPIRSPETKEGCTFRAEKLLVSFELGKTPEYLLAPCWSSAPLVAAEKKDNYFHMIIHEACLQLTKQLNNTNQVEEFSLLLWCEGMEECKSNSTTNKKKSE